MATQLQFVPELRARMAARLVHLVGLGAALGLDVLAEAVDPISAAVDKDRGTAVTE